MQRFALDVGDNLDVVGSWLSWFAEEATSLADSQREQLQEAESRISGRIEAVQQQLSSPDIELALSDVRATVAQLTSTSSTSITNTDSLLQSLVDCRLDDEDRWARVHGRLDALIETAGKHPDGQPQAMDSVLQVCRSISTAIAALESLSNVHREEALQHQAQMLGSVDALTSNAARSVSHAALPVSKPVV